jgi:hypothetical protein
MEKDKSINSDDIFKNPTAISKNGVVVGLQIKDKFFFVYGRDIKNKSVSKLTFKFILN